MSEHDMARLIALFERALPLPPLERGAFLDRECGEDAALRAELSSLLDAHDSATEYFDGLTAQVGLLTQHALGVPNPDLLSRVQEELGSGYRVERELGGGGMSRVFLAEEIRLARKVVIKVLRPEMAATVNAERFRREIRVAAQLQHPHIVPLLTADSSESLVYYTMPFVEGESLRVRLVRDGALALADAVSIWRDVLEALAYAHARELVHRDIKPGNILLGARSARVTDFGIARALEGAAGDAQLTAADLSMGTPAYMAPEQVTGERDADHRVDIYAAGLVMYEMLEGRQPFTGRSMRDVLVARITGDAPPVTRADCPPALVELVSRCLARDPAGRPGSAEVILTEIEQLSTAGVLASSVRSSGTLENRVHMASEASRASEPPARAAGTRRRRRTGRVVALGVALVALAAVAYGASELTAARLRGAVAVPELRDAEASIAVLPLMNLSPDGADAAFADGMTQELIAILGKTGNLRVIASTSAFAFRGAHLDVRRIADSLRVRHVLEGSFQKVGARLRIQLRLVDARDGSTRWSETYDRGVGDMLAVQEEIAGAVARELGVRLSGGDRPGARAKRHTTNIAAYEWYLRGMDVALMRSDSGRRRGIEYFKRAITADSTYAAAYAGLVRMYLGQSNATTRGDHRRWRDLAEAAAQKAVALDDSLAEAHAALGWARMAKRRFAEAEVELKRAIALDANVPRGHEGLARVYLWAGRPAEQLAAARVGVEQDPFSHSAVRELALALSTNGLCDEAVERLRPLKALSPPAGVAGVISGQCHAAQQRWPEAIAEFRWAIESSDARSAPALLGYALARAGERDEAAAILADLLDGRAHSHGAVGIAIVYAGLGNYDQAFAWLDRSVEEELLIISILHPMFAELHRDARFERFRNRLVR